MTADSFIEVDSRTGKRSLERPENKLTRLFEIESHPKESESFLQYGSYVREIRHGVTLNFDQRFDLRDDLGVNDIAARCP